jgi:NAD(P)H dehydrogenase (quinone)
MKMNMLILYYSMYGHTFALCDAAAEGARQVPGTVVTMRRVPETLPADLLDKLGATEAASSFRQDPVASVMELADYDTVIFGSPTRFGNMCGQMRAFLDGAGPLWGSNALVGKVASVMTSSATQHGGQESTILTFIPTLLHLGYVYVGLPYSFAGQNRIDEISGCSPYGASTVAGSSNERKPTANELEGARFQGRHVAMIGSRLAKVG